MQNNIPFINDFWQYRMNRLIAEVDEAEYVDICKHYWNAQRQDKRQLSAGEMLFEVHTFDKGLKYHNAFIDLAITQDPFLHKYRLLSGHAGLRTALAGGEFRKVLGVIPGNFRDLSREEIDQLCKRIVDWFESANQLYASPFSTIADILRNWLKGVYSGIPNSGHPSLFAVEHLLSDRRSLIIETANAVLTSLVKRNIVSSDSSVAVLGAGLWAESISVTLGLNGFQSRQFFDSDLSNRAEVTILADVGVRVKENNAEMLRDTVLIEMLPEQIDPSADEALRQNGVLVVPDLVTASAEEMVEKWLLGGEGVDTWQHCLGLMMDELLTGIDELASKHNLCNPDAALLLAVDRLKDKLIES
jgi:hypothetical protein